MITFHSLKICSECWLKAFTSPKPVIDFLLTSFNEVKPSHINLTIIYLKWWSGNGIVVLIASNNSGLQNKPLIFIISWTFILPEGNYLLHVRSTFFKKVILYKFMWIAKILFLLQNSWNLRSSCFFLFYNSESILKNNI